VDKCERPQHPSRKRGLIKTKALGLSVASLGAGLAVPAMVAPAANANCWSNYCRTFVPNENVNSYVREWGTWGSALSSNQAHYYDCTQVQIWNFSTGAAYYSANGVRNNDVCLRSAYSYGAAVPAGPWLGRATDWKIDGGCNNMWARERGVGFSHRSGWGLYTC
jgi:hypothetical protein